MVRWDGKKNALCSECVLDCVMVMIHLDREWFEGEVDGSKAASPTQWATANALTKRFLDGSIHNGGP